MDYRISLTESATKDIAHFETHEQRVIVAGIISHLKTDAETRTRKKKPLRPNPIAPWELRVESFRVFYSIEEASTVKVVAVGEKEHNDLFIRGKKVAAMKTINLKKESPSVSELLAMARQKSLLLVSQDGATFVLEEADEFDREVAELGNSQKFMRFLRTRSKERSVTSIEQFAEELTQMTHNTPLQPPSRVRRKSKS